jgi:hypothetical protein
MAAPSPINLKESAFDTSGTVAVTLESAPTEGNLLVAVVCGGSSFNPIDPSTSIADSGGNVWALFDSASEDDSGTNYGLPDISIWCAPVTNTATPFTVTLTPNYHLYGRLIVFEVSGPAATSPVSAHGNGHDNSAASNSVDLPNTTDAETLTIGAVRWATYEPTAADGWTALSSGEITTGSYWNICYKQATSTGNYDPSWTATGSDNTAAVAICVRAGDGGAPPPASLSYLMLMMGVG